jgi:hypothetical protein
MSTMMGWRLRTISFILLFCMNKYLSINEGETGYEELDELRNLASGECLSDQEDSDEGDFDGEDDYVDSDDDDRESNLHASSGQSSSSATKGNGTSLTGSSIINEIKSDGTLLSGDSTSIKNPSNFSRVDMSMSSEDLALNFPLYHDALKGINGDADPKNIRNGNDDCGSSYDDINDINDYSKTNVSNITSISSSSSSSGSGRKGQKRNYNEINDTSENSNQSKMNNESVKSLYKERCLELTLKAGEMLYLPAGWFHEVWDACMYIYRYTNI